MLKILMLFLVKLPLIVGVFVSLLYGGMCLYLFKQQQRIIFFPSPTLNQTPADVDLPYDDIWIPVDRGVEADEVEHVHGWWMPSDQPNALGLLYLHGNGDNMSANVSKAAWLQSLGFSILMIDYRGYGLSDGDFPSETQVYADAEVAWDYLTQDLGMAPDDVIVFGHSLGGAIAIELATRHPEMAGLIVEGSFTSILDMSNRTKNYGFLPIDLLLTQRFDSLKKVRSLSVPVLYVHGTADDAVPSDMSATLYAETPSPKELLWVPGAGHTNVADVGHKAYGEAIARLVAQVKETSLVQ